MRQSAMKMLDIDSLDAGYGESKVLHGVHLHVDDGEIVTIIGPNGAGKSTLLKAIMGHIPVNGGSITFDGQEIVSMRPDQRVRAGIGYVPQLANVFPSLTVEENLRMGGYILDKSEVGSRIEEQYEAFPRIAERRRQSARTLSGGERQMLAMARVLMTAPRLVLFDEPSAALSPNLSREVFQKVLEINRGGRTVLIVEQEVEGALAISHRGYVLVDGHNSFEGPADRMLHDENIREAFLGARGAG